MLKSEFGWMSNSGYYFNPFIDTQLRFFVNSKKRIAQNKRTYNYSGNYINISNLYFISEQIGIIGLQYGWQRTYGKHWYNSISFGPGVNLYDELILLIYDIELGYRF